MTTVDIRTTEIPPGFRAVIIPEKVFNFLINRQDWSEVEEPTINQVAEHCNLSIEQSKKT